MTAIATRPARRPRPLAGVRILSLALNLPGPAALMRCRAMGASCVKLEPPAPAGDPMQVYAPAAYAELHAGVRVLQANLKTDAGQQQLHRALARCDVLLTSFRPSALRRLGLGWRQLQRQYPGLSQVAIVGAPGERAEEPGHDLTYQAEHGLVDGLALPPSLYADMGGALAASEAVLQAQLLRAAKGRGVYLEVALTDAAAFLARPRHWGLTTPEGSVGGAHAGYRVYPCRDGRVAVAALEPHFAQALCSAAGLADASRDSLLSPGTHAAIAAFLAGRTRRQLTSLARRLDLPLLVLPR